MAYDELYDDSGSIRPLYRKSHLKYTERTLLERKCALQEARKCVSGDADFLPMVRLLTVQEYRGLVAGVRQRGRALRMFLNDYYFGGHSYVRAGILTRSKVDQIRSRYATSPDQPPLRPENIQFWYGPDLIRGDDGNLRVMEDNVGFIGGMGDLEALADAARALGVSISDKIHPRLFYQEMVASYRLDARRCGGGKVILLSYSQSQRSTHEDERLERIVRALNVTTITDFRKLKVLGGGLFHGKERVGFVIINVNSEDIEPLSSSPYRITGFWSLVSKGQLGVSYAPGLEFVGDKQFCGSVEALVRYYLNEECLLPSLPTLSLETSRSLQKVAKEREQWVIKQCRGQGGDTVSVGKFLSPGAWEKLLNRVEKRPVEFIAQKYCEPSQFLGHAVDLRPLAIISPRGERVSPILWGRAAKDKRSKTNISCGGLLAPVVPSPI